MGNRTQVVELKTSRCNALRGRVKNQCIDVSLSGGVENLDKLSVNALLSASIFRLEKERWRFVWLSIKEALCIQSNTVQ